MCNGLRVISPKQRIAGMIVEQLAKITHTHTKPLCVAPGFLSPPRVVGDGAEGMPATRHRKLEGKRKSSEREDAGSAGAISSGEAQAAVAVQPRPFCRQTHRTLHAL